MSKPSQDAPSLYLVRRPVFDSQRKVWGYELFRKDFSGLEAPGGSGAPDGLLVDLTASGYLQMQQILERGKKVMIPFSEASILQEAPYALPPVYAAVQVGIGVWESAEALESLKRLKSDGYLVAALGLPGGKGAESCARLADIICLETAGLEEKDLAARVKASRGGHALLMARDVADHDAFDRCQKLGFTLFSGDFFKQPQIVSGRGLTSHEVSRLNLLRQVEQDEADVDELAKMVQADPAISFRLLTYLNSSAFSFSRKVNSIQQAIKLLGWKNIRAWLRVVLLADMVQTSVPTQELLFVSVQRGKFLELIAKGHKLDLEPDSAFLLGLFSLLDAMLGMPMADVVDHLPLEDPLPDALLGKESVPYLGLLELARQFENPDWDELERLIGDLDLDLDKVAFAVFASANWVEKFFAPRERG
jgi:EAL and modified HD-GYP domain-containing signal transduction protein